MGQSAEELHMMSFLDPCQKTGRYKATPQHILHVLSMSQRGMSCSPPLQSSVETQISKVKDNWHLLALR